MFENIDNYMNRKYDERISHIDLNDDCIEIGGYDSREYRALLAHYLKTTIPTYKKILLCHKCNNKKCSNVKHLYWGTYKENHNDSVEYGTWKSIYERSVEKYGKEYKKMQSLNGRKGGIKGGGHNKLSIEKIEEYRNLILKCDPYSYGWVSRASNELNLSHTYIRNFSKKYCKDLNFYQRKNTSQ